VKVTEAAGGCVSQSARRNGRQKGSRAEIKCQLRTATQLKHAGARPERHTHNHIRPTPKSATGSAGPDTLRGHHLNNPRTSNNTLDPNGSSDRTVRLLVHSTRSGSTQGAKTANQQTRARTTTEQREARLRAQRINNRSGGTADVLTIPPGFEAEPAIAEIGIVSLRNPPDKNTPSTNSAQRPQTPAAGPAPGLGWPQRTDFTHAPPPLLSHRLEYFTGATHAASLPPPPPHPPVRVVRYEEKRYRCRPEMKHPPRQARTRLAQEEMPAKPGRRTTISFADLDKSDYILPAPDPTVGDIPPADSPSASYAHQASWSPGRAHHQPPETTLTGRTNPPPRTPPAPQVATPPSAPNSRTLLPIHSRA